MSLMQYIPAQKRVGGADKYHGEVVKGYDKKRAKQEKWHAEQSIIEDMLSDLGEESYVLDCPVGTGRFVEFLEEKRFIWTGADISEDMLAEAKTKGKDHNAARIRSRLVNASVLDLPFKENEFDASLMIRLTRWLNPDERTRALQELQRVTKGRIIFTARVENHPYAYPYEDIKKSLCDGWDIHRDEAASEDAYRVIELRRT